MLLKSKIIVVLVLVWTSVALAGGSTSPWQTCIQYLTGKKSQASAVVETSEPKQVDSIAAKIEITVDHHGEAFATLIRPGQKLRGRHYGDGTAILSTLKAQSLLSTPTTMRVEERAVITASEVKKFISDSAKSFVWTGRQESEDLTPGYHYVNLTEAGRYMDLAFGDRVVYSVKARYRHYLEVPDKTPNDVSTFKRSMVDKNLGPLVSFELKFSGQEGPKDGSSLLAYPDSVFKPRLLLTPLLADKMQAISGDADYLTALAELKNEVLALQADGHALNNPEYVEEDFQAIQLLLAKEPDFLKPVVVIANGRTAYEAQTTEGKYQFTEDFDLRFYDVDNNIGEADVLNYFSKKPFGRSLPDERYVELKSPIPAVQQALPLYNSFIRRIRARHLPKHPLGKGKYNLARSIQESIGDQPIDPTLIDGGTDFWLVKGTGQLNTVLKDNDVLKGKRMVTIAIPFTARNGNSYRLILSYQPSNGNVQKAQTSKSAYLYDLYIRDRYDHKVELDAKIVPFLNELIDKHDDGDELIGLDIEGVVFPVKAKLTPEEHQAYITFMRRFYQYETFFGGSERDAGVLAVIQATDDVPKVVRRLQVDNTLQFVRVRLVKNYPTLILGIALTTLAQIVPFDKIGVAISETVHTQIERIEHHSIAALPSAKTAPAPIIIVPSKAENSSKNK